MIINVIMLPYSRNSFTDTNIANILILIQNSFSNMRLTKLLLKTEEGKKLLFISQSRDFRGAVGHYVTVGGIKGSLSLFSLSFYRLCLPAA